jgi:predicted transposase/invertase (TIGR01784 family)
MIKRARTVEDLFAQSEQERIIYNQREKGLRDFTIAMNNAEKRGIEKGIERGELAASVKIARGLLSDGISPDVVAKNTGLSLDEVKRLAES